MTVWDTVVKDIESYSEGQAVSIDFAEAERQRNTIHCNVGSTEMIRVTPDGFWVRGVKVEQDEKEAETVYKAFRQFLVWAELNKA